jgi:hypothetical protein
MRLVDGVGIVVTQLLDDFFDPIEFLGCCKISNDPFQATDIVNMVRFLWSFVEDVEAYSNAPTFRLSYSLSFRARWIP